jgi:putative OPT family oligopeptide transporter
MPGPVPPQLTVKAVLLGTLLSAVLAGANAYLGLFAGMTVSASIPAAVISMAVLKLFRESNILENNIVQTAASAGESLAAGVIFTLPALIILGFWSTFDYYWVTVIAGLGGLLGVLFTIPLRRELIVTQALPYPEGTATAEVLKVGGGAGRGARALAGAGVVGASIKLCETGFRLWPESAQAAAYVGGSGIAYVGTNLSPALLAVGYIVRLNIAVLVFLGGVISWYVAIPLYSAFFLGRDAGLSAQLANGAPAVDLAFAIWTSKIRYLGVGAMLVGGVWALISLRGALLSGIKEGLSRKVLPGGAEYDHAEHDTPMRLVLSAIAVLVIPIFALYHAIVGTVGVGLAMTVIMVVAGFLFSAVAAYMAGLVGSSNNPISGITIATILFTSLLLLGLMGDSVQIGSAAAIMVGAVVCSAAAIGGDNMQDLKAGHLVGATPWRQQAAQALGVVAAVLVMAPILNLLLMAYGIGAPSDQHPNALLAPQATLMASVAEGVFRGGLPWTMVGLGAAIGVGLVAADEYLRHRGASWRLPVLAVAVGIYLPLQLSVPILAGGVVAHLAERRNRQASRSDRMREGLLFSAGMITGEALVGIALAVPIVWSGNANVAALPLHVPSLVGLGVLGGVTALLYRVATRP